MKKMLIIGGALVLVAAAAFFFIPRGNSGDISQMARNGATDKELMDAIDRGDGSKKVTADQIIELKKADVSDDVIIQMIRKNGSTAGETTTAVK